MKNLPFILLCVLFGNTSLAQDSIPPVKLSNIVNLGISVGVGGNRSYFVSPLVRVKTGPFYLKGIIVPDGGTFEGGVDFLEIDKQNTSSNTLVNLSIGITEYDRLVDRNKWYYNLSYLAGINRYIINKRIHYGAKIGVIDVFGGEYNTDNRTYGYYPYAEVSVGWSILKHQKRNPPRIKNIDDAFALLSRAEKQPNLTFRKFFNPYLSVGVGRDRLSLYPNIGIQSGPIFIEGVYASNQRGSYSNSWTTNIGYFFSEIAYQNLRINPLVAVHFKTQQEQEWYPKTSIANFEEIALLAGVSIGHPNMSSSIRFQGGIGKYYHIQVNDTQTTEVNKIRPVLGISLVLKMFK